MESHFLTCFVSLVILRLLEQKTAKKYSISKMIESMRNYNCTTLSHSINLFNAYDDIIEFMANIYNIKLDNSLVSTQTLKKFFKL